MKFCVCIKQVPDVTAPIHTGRVVLNAYDASAVEEALVLTEKYGGQVDLVLIGPANATETIRKALAMGAEQATHLVLDEGVACDSMAVATLLATDAGLAGGMLAAQLGRPYASNAVGLDLEGQTLVVRRQGDVGQEMIALPVPCLVTCSNDMNDPRIPTLKGIMGAKKKEITTLDAAALGGPAPTKTRVLGFEAVPDREPGQLLQGEAEEIARLLVGKLHNEARVL